MKYEICVPFLLISFSKRLLFQKLLSNGGRDEFGARDFGEYEICFQVFILFCL